jgi:L,D-transpeptidase YcbB
VRECVTLARMQSLPNRYTRATLLILVAVSLAPAATCAQELDELIRARVEQLRATGELEVDGVSLAAKNLIPRIYEARAFAPTWRSAEQIDSLLEVIDESVLEGLDPADYHVDAVRTARATFSAIDTLPSDERADLDLMLTDSVIRLGYHLRFGKVDPVALDSTWNFSRELTDRDPAQTIQAAIDAPSMSVFASEVIPRGYLYRRLKAALAEYRAIADDGGWPTLAAGPTLKAGMIDERVPVLVQRLAVTGDIAEGIVPPPQTLYDDELVSAVRRFQRRHGLASDGAIGAATLAALNVPVAARIEQLRANLERARWVLGELENDFVLVNIAAFRLDLVRNGEVAWQTRVVVGQPYRKTPVFKSTMRYLVFNPTWTVPPTIISKDFLPELRRNPEYLATRNIDLLDQSEAIVDPTTVDWSSRRGFPYRFVQRPGPNNALGRVKFMFPNDQFIYLHDTPSRDLFTRQTRAFSSGCIRVEHPFELALELLGPNWSQARIDALLATARTETVFLDTPIPVLLQYWTAEVDETGQIFFWSDIYERDAAVIAELNAPFHATPTL